MSSQKISQWQKYLIRKELSGKKLASYGMIQKMLPRLPTYNYNKMHPRAKLIFKSMIQKPLPLDYKLKDYNDSCINTPLGTDDNIPFSIKRTHTNNLPVYTRYKQQHEIKRTVIRHINGDVNDLVKEVKKITSNSEVEIKVGRIEIKGLHAEKIKNYLYRLGF